MGINSYAQNLEDVMLWRAVGIDGCACYVDVGAQHPIVDSVSLAFYERGWRGVHVEPVEAYAHLLRERRPDEVVVGAVLGDKPGRAVLHELRGTGLSTLDAAICEKHRAAGYKCAEREVDMTTLDAVLAMVADREVRWLKIDVEGAERQVLAGWRNSTVRPWVVVVESTEPMSQTPTHANWEHLIVAHGYLFAYFDGLNRFYVDAKRPELLRAFLLPPNIFDQYTLRRGQDSEVNRKLEEILASRSWRVTAPIRAMSSYLRGIRCPGS